jgi:hypothetical protein
MAIVAVGLLVAMPRAHACSCALPLPPVAARDAAAAVFEGFVLSSTGDPQTYSRTVRLQVMRAWKGANVDTVVAVQTPDNGAACGVNAPDGELMLVYALSGDAGLRMILCSRTTLSSAAQDDFAALGPPAQIAMLAPGALRGSTGAGGAIGTAGRSGSATVGLVRVDGCTVAGRPAAGVAVAATAIFLAFARVRRRRR